VRLSIFIVSPTVRLSIFIVSPTVRLSIFISVINQIDAQNFVYKNVLYTLISGHDKVCGSILDVCFFDISV